MLHNKISCNIYKRVNSFTLKLQDTVNLKIFRYFEQQAARSIFRSFPDWSGRYIRSRYLFSSLVPFRVSKITCLFFLQVKRRNMLSTCASAVSSGQIPKRDEINDEIPDHHLLSHVIPSRQKSLGGFRAWVRKLWKGGTNDLLITTSAKAQLPCHSLPNSCELFAFDARSLAVIWESPCRSAIKTSKR